MNRAASQSLTAWIVRTLEKHFTEPVWPGPKDFLTQLIGTLLSQNTNDRNAEAAFQNLLNRYRDWHAVMNSPVRQIATAIRTAGLGNQKARHIKSLLQWINKTWATFDLSFLCHEDANTLATLFLAQKGIGVKTLSVTLMAACGHDVFPVDTHVHRLCTRLGLVPAKFTAEKTFIQMQSLVPKGKGYSLHHNLIRLGRTICQARRPQCAICPLAAKCPSAAHK